MRLRLFVSSMCFATALVAAPKSGFAQEFMKPTKQHEDLKHEVGVWDAEVSMWPSPDSEPVKSKAVEKNEMLGKMWLMSEFEGEFGGEKFTGASAIGYDPIKKKYVGGWVDSMSPFMMKMQGEYDESTDTLTMHGEGVNAMTGKLCKSKLVTKYTGEDSKTFEMYREPDGGGDMFKALEIKYTRRD